MKICLYDSGLGVLPFVKVILKNNLGNDYYLYLDQNNFPYGNKKEEELINILKNNLFELEKHQFDLILILCNTMSYIYIKSDLNYQNVRCILDINLRAKNDYKLFCTNYLYNKLDNSINGANLALNIEEINIVEIINIIISLKDKVILGCTHYHLIKDLLSLYNKDHISLEEKFLSDIPHTDKVNIYVRKQDYFVIKKYLKKVIYFY
jgi:glutamate racemase